MLFQQQLYFPPAQKRADPKRIMRRCLKATTYSVCAFKVDDPKRDMILIHELSQCCCIWLLFCLTMITSKEIGKYNPLSSYISELQQKESYISEGGHYLYQKSHCLLFSSGSMKAFLILGHPCWHIETDHHPRGHGHQHCLKTQKRVAVWEPPPTPLHAHPRKRK